MKKFLVLVVMAVASLYIYPALAQVAAPAIGPAITAPAVAASFSLWGWLSSNWQAILTILIAADALLIDIFPTNTLFTTIKNFLATFQKTTPPTA